MRGARPGRQAASLFPRQQGALSQRCPPQKRKREPCRRSNGPLLPVLRSHLSTSSPSWHARWNVETHPGLLPPLPRLNIHPTALIDPSADLEEDVEVGPFAVIEAGVRIASGCLIRGHAQILASVAIGENCEIGHNAIIGAPPQDLHFDRSTPSGVRLGPDNIIREHVTIHRSSREGGVTEIGRGNLIMVGCHLGHDTVMGDGNILANHCLLGGHVRLGDRAFLGGGAAFHQFVRIGSLAMIKGLSAISQDVPPYVLVSDSNRVRGLNVVGMRRAGLAGSTRQDIKDAFRKMFLQGLNRDAALDATRDREWGREAQEFIDFFREPTSRGICRP